VQKDVSINTAIRRLRISLQDHDPSNGLIETVGSRGYRLKVAVEWLPNAGSEKPAALERIAVVPFADLNCPADDFFSDGLTEVTIAHLGRSCKNIAVVAPLWSSRAKHNSQNLLRVAQQLHAEFVLSGTVSRSDGCLRVTARLVRSNDQSCVWTQSYVRDPRNFLAVQEEISADIAHEILPALADANATD
jgi:TolB-like protein